MEQIIEVQDLGKKYLITHEGQESYTALRDVIAKSVATAGRQIVRSKSQPPEPRPSREEFWALKDVNFSIDRGERIGIIGRNGAGKSTLLKLLSRITEPSTGQITLRGRIASLLEVGTGFHPELTGRENIFLNGALLGMTKKEIVRKFDEIVDFAEVERFLDTPVKRYSSGMYVRLAFAVAAHLEPEILIIDEVLAVGDLKFRTKCLGKMQEVGASGRTVLFVSHDLSAIRQLCDRTILLNKGGIIADGDTDEVTAQYEKAALDGDNSLPAIRQRTPVPAGFHFSKVAICNQAGKPCTTFQAGESLQLHFWTNEDAPQDSFTIEYFLLNESGNRISVGNANPMTDTYFDASQRHIVCHLGPLPLTSGRYHFDFSTRVWGLERWDTWENAIGFQITRSDIFGSGYDVAGGVNGDFVLPQQWEAVSIDSTL